MKNCFISESRLVFFGAETASKFESVEKGKNVHLKDVINCKNDRGWMATLEVTAETASDLRDAAEKGFYLEDNYSKSNGFHVKDKKDNTLGTVTVFLNDNWEIDLKKVLDKRFEK